jgi:hypothetical protein
MYGRSNRRLAHCGWKSVIEKALQALFCYFNRNAHCGRHVEGFGLELVWMDDSDTVFNQAPPWACYITEEGDHPLVIVGHSLPSHCTLIS